MGVRHTPPLVLQGSNGALVRQVEHRNTAAEGAGGHSCSLAHRMVDRVEELQRSGGRMAAAGRQAQGRTLGVHSLGHSRRVPAAPWQSS